MVVASGRGVRFTGTVQPGGARFVIDGDPYNYFYPELVERIEPETFLVIDGQALTTITSDGLVGVLLGYMAFYRTQPGRSWSGPYAFCRATDTRFALLK